MTIGAKRINKFDAIQSVSVNIWFVIGIDQLYDYRISGFLCFYIRIQPFF